MYSGHQRWPEARERLPEQLLLEQRFENNDGGNSEYLGEELPWLREGTNAEASMICSRKREDSRMEEGVEKSKWSHKVMGRECVGGVEAAVTAVRSSWGQGGGRGDGSGPSLINLPVRQAPDGLACKESACDSGAAGAVVRSLDQEDPLEEEIETHSSILA